MLIGAIADDFTGASDLANALARGGMRTIQTVGVPAADLEFGDADAVVVALKTRTIAPSAARDQSLAALAALERGGARQVMFKYCSTFDSTDRGNIGPVAEALATALGSELTVFVPSFPANGRRVFGGYLFVGDVLLSESGMRDHPLTPMTDANLVRVLARQTSWPVGRVDLADVRRGGAAIASALAALRARGVRFAIVDATEDDDVHAIGTAVAGDRLVTGGSGIGLGLPANFRRQGLLGAASVVAAMPAVAGAAAVVAGSCSTATLAQVARFRASAPAYDVDLGDLDDPDAAARRIAAWAQPLLARGPVLVTSSSPPERVAATHARLGREEAGARIERVLAATAVALVHAGVRRLVVAGGETSGAVVGALGVGSLEVGPQIEPGVPWTLARDSAATRGEALALALKSGNFGGPDFFTHALDVLAREGARA